MISCDFLSYSFPDINIDIDASRLIKLSQIKSRTLFEFLEKKNSNEE